MQYLITNLSSATRPEQILPAMLSALVVILLAVTSVQSSQSRPNIVFILSDDQGYHDIGYHGSEFPTPHLDTLAMSGVRLENYYVQPVCSPSRSQLMTGKYQVSLYRTRGGGGGLVCPVSVVLGGELLCPARVLAIQESAHDWQVPGESMLYRGRGRKLQCPVSVVQGGENYYVQSVCSLSRSQLMTGKYQVSLYRTGGGENYNVQSRWYWGENYYVQPV